MKKQELLKQNFKTMKKSHLKRTSTKKNANIVSRNTKTKTVEMFILKMFQIISFNNSLQMKLESQF